MGRILFEALVWTWMLEGSTADRSIENWSHSQSPGQDQSRNTEKNGRHCVCVKLAMHSLMKLQSIVTLISF